MIAASQFVSREAPARSPARGAVFALSVVVVNYRQWANTARLVAQLRRARVARRGRVEIVVVDNSSPPHPARRAVQRLPNVTLRRFRRNRGFARGVNEGVRLGVGDWILLLNPDVTVAADFLDRVVRLTRAPSAERLGVIGLRVQDPGGALQGSVGTDPTLLGTLVGQWRSRPVRKCRPLHGDHRRRVSWASGCSLLVRRDCFEQLGGFDEGFFLYYEDADLCRRARAAGWVVCHEPALAVTHHHPLHGRELSPRMLLLTRHALLNYARKYWNPWAFFALALIVVLESCAREWLAANRRDRSLFRRARRIAVDMALGNARAAYRTIWAAAQRRSKPGPHSEARHGRRPHPR